MVGSAAPIEVYNLANGPVQLFARKHGNEEGGTHKFHGGQENGKGEGEYDAPKLPILWHAVGEFVGGLGPEGGWMGWW